MVASQGVEAVLSIKKTSSWMAHGSHRCECVRGMLIRVLDPVKLRRYEQLHEGVGERAHGLVPGSVYGVDELAGAVWCCGQILFLSSTIYAR